MKCLEKDRNRRYETANGLAMDVQRHLSYEPILARPPSSLYLVRKMARRNKVIFAAGAAVAATIILGLAVSVWQSMEKSKAYRRAVSAERDRSIQLARSEREAHRAETAAADAARSRDQALQNLYVADLNVALEAIGEHDLARARKLLARHEPSGRQPDRRGFEWRFLWEESRSREEATLDRCRQSRAWRFCQGLGHAFAEIVGCADQHARRGLERGLFTRWSETRRVGGQRGDHLGHVSLADSRFSS